ncbi:MAG TPA: 50S ribosomal protein L18 [Candidatus Paceibacterota bacterium]|nr:50S ribosomal protein L18 [Candidatus Paceibacterota bacterium]
MTRITDKQVRRTRRHARIRARISGTAERPRVSVFKSNRHVFVQAVDDASGKTLASVGFGSAKGKGSKTDHAKKAGGTVAGVLKEKGISKAVFDVGGYAYHGRVRAVAEGLREGGITV